MGGKREGGEDREKERELEGKERRGRRERKDGGGGGGQEERGEEGRKVAKEREKMRGKRHR